MKTTLLSLALAAGLLAPAQAAEGKVQRTVPAGFTGSETFDVGMDTCSAVADAYFDKAPFEFEGKLKRLYFKNLSVEQPAFVGLPDD